MWIDTATRPGAVTLLLVTLWAGECAAPAAREPTPARRPAPSPATAPVTTAATGAADDRYARGVRVLGRLDPAAPRRVVDGYAKIAPDFGRYVIEYPFGEIYAGPGLDTRTRLLAAVAALTAVGDTEVPLAHHVRYALNAGCTREEVVEVIVQTSVYGGFPRAVKGLAVAERVFSEVDQAGGALKSTDKP